jgi:hypothetical protein
MNVTIELRQIEMKLREKHKGNEHKKLVYAITQVRLHNNITSVVSVRLS